MASITAKQVGDRKRKSKPDFQPKIISKEAETNVEYLSKELGAWSVGFLDIEATGLSADFGFMLGACILHGGSGKIDTFRIDESPDYKNNLCDDQHVVLAVKEALTKFDVLVTWNGDNYDLPFIDTRLTIHGEQRSGLVHNIDLLPIARKKLRLHSNKLDSVATALRVKHEKTKLDPMVWQRASHGSKEDLSYIIHHCQLDCIVLAEVFTKMKGYVDAVFRRR